jgi:hypothetical protein
MKVIIWDNIVTYTLTYPGVVPTPNKQDRILGVFWQILMDSQFAAQQE